MNDEKCLRFCRLSSASFAVKYEISLVSWVITRQKASLKPPPSPFQSSETRRCQLWQGTHTHMIPDNDIKSIVWRHKTRFGGKKAKDAPSKTYLTNCHISDDRKKLCHQLFDMVPAQEYADVREDLRTNPFFLRMTWLKIIVMVKISTRVELSWMQKKQIEEEQKRERERNDACALYRYTENTKHRAASHLPYMHEIQTTLWLLRFALPK